MQRKLLKLRSMLLLSAMVLLLAAPARSQETETFPEELKLGEEYQTSVFACLVPQKSAKVLRAEYQTLHGKPVLSAYTDRNYDGALDMILIFDAKPTKGNDEYVMESPFPHYYVLDSTFSGQPDKAYRDINGDGKCTSMQEVPVNYLLQDSDPKDKA